MNVNEVDYSELREVSEADASSLVPNLNMLKHVNVTLDVRVGNATLSVADLFNLKSGNVIALDRDVDEPIELLLGGKLIAVGHLAVSDNQLGIRITEILNSDTQLAQ